MPLCVPKCPDCPFLSQHTVGTKGPEDSPFVVCGESPGKEEMHAELPFVGKSGKVLDFALDQGVHVPPFFTNSFKCYPILGKGQSEAKQEKLNPAIVACNSRLIEEVSAHPRKAILAVGNGALRGLTQNINLKITQERGKVFYNPRFGNTPIIASVHPAYLLRGSGSWREFKADVDLAMRLARGEVYQRPENTTWEVIDHPLGVLWLAHHIAKHPLAASDTETSGFSFIRDRILCIGFTVNGTHVYIVPEHLIKYIHWIFTLAPNTKFAWHNGKFDVKFCRRAGATDARVDEDTMLISYDLDEIRGIHDLESVAKDWLNSPNWKAALDAYLPKKNTSYEVIPKPILYKYMAYDISNTFNLVKILRPKIAADINTEKLYTRSLIPASEYLSRVEANGINVDPRRVRKNIRRLKRQADGYEAELNVLCAQLRGPGATVNPRSPIQLVKLLFDPPIPTAEIPLVGFGIPTKVRSTDDDTLQSLPSHPALDLLRKHRTVAKRLGTYGYPYQELVESDGAVHTSFLLHGSATGRLASREPNLQNVPRDRAIRGSFVARKGRRFIEVDLNQAELRSLACLSGDEAFCKIYETEGMSLHEVVRNDIFGDPKSWSESQVQQYLAQFRLAARFSGRGDDQIKEEQKMRAKAVNFGIVYGRTAPSLAEEFEIPTPEAQRWIDAWFARFPQARMFIQVCRNAPAKGMDLLTPFGHRKRHRVVSQAILTSLQNEAANYPHQSVASYITMHGGIILEPILKTQFDTYTINTVHDSILFDAPDDDDVAREVIKMACSTLERVPPVWGLTRIPFKADAKMGKRWGSLKEPTKEWLAGAPGLRQAA